MKLSRLFLLLQHSSFHNPHHMPSTSRSSLSNSLTSSQMRTLGSVILTEHFRFAPELFAKGCFDIANKTLYSATQHAEEELNQVLEHRTASGEGADEEDWDKKQREEIQRVSLETLSLLD